MEHLGRRMFRLVEPIGVVTYQAEEPTAALMALGLGNVWDAYFAGRAASLGRVPAAVVDAAFYNFADGEVARHVPAVWETATPEAAAAARQQGSVAALSRILGDLVASPGVARAADLLLRVGTSAPIGGRVLFASVRELPVPDEPLARLWHAATLLREHRGDGHIAALLTAGIGRTESHVLHALSEGTPAAKFGRLHHLPRVQLRAVIEGMRDRGLIDESGRLSPAGRATKAQIEATTDELAAPAYDVLTADELAELIALLTPIAATLDATGSR